jgi:hypothetical protein
MSNTGEQIGTNYPTLMPALTDLADIQEAFSMYHYGDADYQTGDPINPNSIEGHFSFINNRADVVDSTLEEVEERLIDLETRPTAAAGSSLSEAWWLGS